MNKADLITALKNETDLSKSKSEAESTVNLFFDQMSNALASGERVEIRGLCSFYVKKYKSYNGRNPKTGEQVKIMCRKNTRTPVRLGVRHQGTYQIHHDTGRLFSDGIEEDPI